MDYTKNGRIGETLQNFSIRPLKGFIFTSHNIEERTMLSALEVLVVVVVVLNNNDETFMVIWDTCV